MTGSTSPSAWADDIGSCNGHGTHVAGTIAARRNDIGVVGVAPDVLLYGIKVFENLGGSCLAYQSKQIAGLNWAVNNGIRVVSISIGGTTINSSYQSAISSASAQGVYVVASAGTTEPRRSPIPVPITTPCRSGPWTRKTTAPAIRTTDRSSISLPVTAS